MAGKKITKRERQRLADPATHSAMDAAQAEAGACFDNQIAAVFAEMNGLLAGRHPRDLVSGESVRFMALKARLDALAIEQRDFAGAALERRLGPRDGSETVDA